MSDIKRPIAELAEMVASGKTTAKQLVKQSLEAIDQNKHFHSILEINEEAIKAAEDIDEQIKNGKEVGSLAGVPFIAKDNFLTFGTKSTAGSNILNNFKAPYQATSIQMLQDEGAILVAKANLDAFGHGSSTENSDFGPSKNPHDESKIPGGSSGGSAAAISLGIAAFSLATDTGGSIRQPAAMCGVVGLKPTYGLVSRYGVVAMGSSFDSIGVIANRVEDASLVLEYISGKDPSDATTIDRDEHSYAELSSTLEGQKFGLVKEFIGEGVDPEVKSAIMDAVEKIKERGGAVEDVSLPSLDLALGCYYVLVPAEISSNLARYDGIRYGHSSKEAKSINDQFFMSRNEGFGDEAKRRIMIGTYVLSSGYYDAYYKKAQKVRTLIRKDFDGAFKNYDFLIGPTSPIKPWNLGEKSHDPLAMYLTDIDTVAVNLVGSPAISIPLKTDDLPVGLQLVGPQKSEHKLLSAAAGLEGLS